MTVGGIRSAVLLALALLVTGCAVDPAPSSPARSSPAALPMPSDTPPPGPAANDPAAGLPYACAGDPFDIRVFSVPPTAENSNDAAVDGLRKTIAIDASLPRFGWWLIGRSANAAQFATHVGQAIWYVRVELRDGSWNVHSWGDCTPRLQVAGVSTARWSLDPDEPPPGPQTRVIRAVVTEDCVPEPLEGRLEAPIVRAAGDIVMVAFTARPPVGPDARLPQRQFATVSFAGRDLHDICMGSSSVTVDVDLGQPLGDRFLVDGGTWPGRDVRQPPEP